MEKFAKISVQKLAEPCYTKTMKIKSTTSRKVYAVVDVTDMDTWTVQIGIMLYPVTEVAKKLVPKRRDGDTGDLMLKVQEITRELFQQHGVTHVVVHDPQLLMEFPDVDDFQPTLMMSPEDYLGT